MIMNSNVVYGAAVCHNGSSPADYQNYHHTHAELSYYPPPSELSTGPVSAAGPVPNVAANSHYGPPLHMSPATHQFAEHHTGIISESNGLSYTNLDSQSNYGTVSPHPRLNHYNDARNAAVIPNQTPQSLQTAVHSGPVAHQGYAQYREYGNENVSVTSVHQEMVNALTDCAVMRTVANSGPAPTQYSYLDPNLLSRRNGSTTHHAALGTYNTDPTAFTEMSCSQLNGTAYHLNHIASHLHHSPHHHHHHHGGGRPAITGVSPVSAAAPVPTYKWMQVKRNVPKPGE
ncbi:homeobox protein Hox-B1b-like protein [Leptotrombidium deliense]|uniref:Homeobox protein Hox-B1b-like protein n=1 Tax=Leptotrombidium deliense TaxID=299467 RepID=A0A443SKZ9_9ACAR|nr:homeobox protein Hox-B1b-like protein [Leptotrombidium deliense]